MSKIPTAEEFLLELLDKDEFVTKSALRETIFQMKEFAKLHVNAALKAASEKAETEDVGSIGRDGEYHSYDIVNKQSILNAYPDENIK